MSLLHMLMGQAQQAISLYVIPHQDDEVLTTGAAIQQEVAEGRTVVVLSTNRGENSNARTNPALISRLGYTPTKEQFSAARDREFTETVLRLGGTPVVPPYALRQSDGFSDGAAIAALVRGMFSPTVALRATGPTDYHIDHRACGDAVQALAAEGWGTDHRLFIASSRIPEGFWPPGEPVNQMGEHGDVSEYHTWAYKHIDVPSGWWGVGYTSAAPRFDYCLDVDGASYWHHPID